MRISGLANVSTGSLPDAELTAIDRLFEGTDARHPLDYHGIPIVAHPYGFLAHTCMVLDDDKPTASRSGFGIFCRKANTPAATGSCSTAMKRDDLPRGFLRVRLTNGRRLDKRACTIARLPEHRRGPSA